MFPLLKLSSKGVRKILSISLPKTTCLLSHDPLILKSSKPVMCHVRGYPFICGQSHVLTGLNLGLCSVCKFIKFPVDCIGKK